MTPTPPAEPESNDACNPSTEGRASPIDINPSLRRIDAASGPLNASVTSLGETPRDLQAAVAEVRATTAEIRAASQSLTDATATSSTTLTDFQTSLDRLLSSLRSSGKLLENVEKVGPSLKEFFDLLRAYEQKVRGGLEKGEAERQERLGALIDPVGRDLQALEKRVEELAGRVAATGSGVGELEATRRVPLGYRVLAWAGALVVLTVGVALLFLVEMIYRQSKAAGIDKDASLVAAIDRELGEVDGRIKEVQDSVRGVKASASELAALKPQLEKIATSAATAVRGVETGREKLDAAVRDLTAVTALNRKALDGMGDRLATALTETVTEAVNRPIGQQKVSIDDLSSRVDGLAALLRKLAQPERTLLVLFNSKEMRAESCRSALTRLLFRSPLRWGYEDYQVALAIVKNGQLQSDSWVVPFGTDPAPSEPFRKEWTTEDGSADDFVKFDPRGVLPREVPPGVALRCVLIVGPGAAPPAIEDARWPKSAMVHAIVVGNVPRGRLTEWGDFCRAHGKGIAVPVAADADQLHAELVRLTAPRQKAP